MQVPLWLKIGWTVWLLVWAPAFWKYYGAQNFLYFCDLGNFLIGIALWLESPLFFSWAATWLLLFQTLYLVDLVGALLASRHVIGGTEYMFDGSLTALAAAAEPVSCGDSATIALGCPAVGLRQPRLGAGDADNVGCGSRQLFLAASI